MIKALYRFRWAALALAAPLLITSVAPVEAQGRDDRRFERSDRGEFRMRRQERGERRSERRGEFRERRGERRGEFRERRGERRGERVERRRDRPDGPRFHPDNRFQYDNDRFIRRDGRRFDADNRLRRGADGFVRRAERRPTPRRGDGIFTQDRRLNQAIRDARRDGVVTQREAARIERRAGRLADRGIITRRDARQLDRWEDRVDQRFDFGRRDRVEDRYDRRTTIAPRAGQGFRRDVRPYRHWRPGRWVGGYRLNGHWVPRRWEDGRYIYVRP